MKKHYYIGKVFHRERGMDAYEYMAACGYQSYDPNRLTLNEKFTTCLHCKRYANLIPADELGPVAELAREK